MTDHTTRQTTDQITVRVTLDAYDFAHPAEKQTQVYVQIPEVARVSYMLPSARFHALKDRAWPEVIDVAQEYYAQGWVIDPSSAVARQAVAEWLRDAANRDALQAAYEEDQARQDPVLRNLRARINELETDRAANDREYEQATARIAELEARLDDVHRTPQDQLTVAEVRLAQYRGRTKTWLTATYDSGAEKALHEIACGLRDALEVVRDQRNSDRLKVMGLKARVAELEAAQGTAYRASHDSIVMGLYRTAAEARKHCEAKVRQEEPDGSILHMSWSADDIGPEAEYELHITPAETGGLIRGTGYVVTPLEIAAEYDAEADQ